MTPLAERLRHALETGAAAGPVLLTGDGGDPALFQHDTVRAAAVLVAVTDRNEPGVILTRRTETLSRHAGQVAFPGGGIDEGEDPVTAALREAREEIGLDPADAQVIGPADHYRTVTGFDVLPIVAVVPPDLAYAPSDAEVAEVFEAPLAFLLDEANHTEASVEWQGRERHYYEIHWDGQRIWGATAAMIVNLARRLRWSR